MSSEQVGSSIAGGMGEGGCAWPADPSGRGGTGHMSLHDLASVFTLKTQKAARKDLKDKTLASVAVNINSLRAHPQQVPTEETDRKQEQQIFDLWKASLIILFLS